MNTALTQKEVQDFIHSFTGDYNRLAFSGSPFPSVSTQELLQQLKGRQKAGTKLPTWAKTKGIIYPPSVNIEQTSSETTARYKASLVEGKTLADLTGGLGVDSYYFSKKIEQITYFELNRNLFEIAQHNFKQLNAENIRCYHEDGIQKVRTQKYDVIYLDPSRRHDQKGKVFFLQDCEPNLPNSIDSLILQAEVVMVKTSPMLDFSIGLTELPYTHCIHVVSVQNEVKELLWILQKEHVSKVTIKTINFTKNGIQQFDFMLGESPILHLGNPKKYLYEPNVAILKSGGYDLLSERFNIEKLHRYSHLFTSDELIDFPGRQFTITEVIPYQKKTVKQLISGSQANVSTRNFPETVAQLQKKWKIKDGGKTYLFFTTVATIGKVVLVCEKIKNNL